MKEKRKKNKIWRVIDAQQLYTTLKIQSDTHIINPPTWIQNKIHLIFLRLYNRCAESFFMELLWMGDGLGDVTHHSYQTCSIPKFSKDWDPFTLHLYVTDSDHDINPSQKYIHLNEWSKKIHVIDPSQKYVKPFF